MAKRLIPPKTKQKSIVIPSFKLTWVDIAYIIVIMGIILIIWDVISDLKIKLAISLLCALFAFLGVLKDMNNKPIYQILFQVIMYLFRNRNVDLFKNSEIVYEKDYLNNSNLYQKIFEIKGIDFDILTEFMQDKKINELTYMYELVKTGKIIKMDKKLDLKDYINQNINRLETLKNQFEKNYEVHIKLLENRIKTLLEKQENKEENIIVESYYLITYSASLSELENKENMLISYLNSLSLEANILKKDKIIEFYNRFYDIENENENENKEFEYLLDIKEKAKHIIINDKPLYISSIGKMPLFVENAWISKLLNIPNTKVVMSFEINENKRKISNNIDNSIIELKFRKKISGLAHSEKIKLDYDIASLEELNKQLEIDTQALFSFKFYIIYSETEKKEIEQAYSLLKFEKDNLWFNQVKAIKEINPYDFKINLVKDNIKDVQIETLSASFPFISKTFMDKFGQYLGYNDAPVFFDQFTSWKNLDPKRKNANLICIGESGGGKSYFTKALNLMHTLDNKKIFILDPENEYSHMANILGGNIIDIGGVRFGRINPLQIFESQENKAEEKEISNVSNHIQFLESFFEMVIKNIDQYSLSFLKEALKNLYYKFNIHDNIKINELEANKFPLMSDLYNEITLMINDLNDNNLDNFKKETLIKLQVRLKDFIGDAAYAKLWNGYTTLNLDNNFTVFNFQSLFANGNYIVANGQMMLVIRLLMQEIIKNKNNNDVNNLNKNIVITIEEAHQFIDPDFPVALNFMAVMVRRIRKYGGAMIITTQNIADFIGHSDRAKQQATTIINNCAYSVIFGLKQDGIISIDNLYKGSGAGRLTKNELNFIASAKQGEALFIVSPQIRFFVHIELYKGETDIIERRKL